MATKTLAIAVAAMVVGSIATLGAQRLGEKPQTAAAAAPETQAELIEHGHYVVKIAGCHDCHTPGYALMGGQVDDKTYLIGDSIGWQGGWGTTYPINLRKFMQGLTEEQWLQIARTNKARPPMPWMTLHAMSDRDLRATYQYIRSLGDGGDMPPAYVPPNEQAKTPVIKFPEMPAS